MKKIVKFFLIIVLFLIVVFIGACIFVGLKGKDIATAKLEEILNTNVEIGSVNVSFPLDLKINSLDIENLLKVDEIHISFGVIDLLKRDIELPGLRLLRPQLIVRRTAAGINLLGANLHNHSFCEHANRFTPLGTNFLTGSVQVVRERSFLTGFTGRNLVFAATEEITTNIQEAAPLSIMINKLVVKDGKIKFIDETLEPEAFQIGITNINIKAYRISFPPKPSSMRVDLTADIVTGAGDVPHSTIKGEGWIDFVRKDMQGNIEIVNLDGIYFHPYYQKTLSRKLKSANVNLRSDLTAKSNDLTADCHLEIKDLLFEETETVDLKDFKILDIIGGSLAQKSRDIKLNFVIKTKLDNPKIDSAQIRGIVLDKVLEGVVSQVPEETIGGIKDVGEKIKEIGKELEDRFKDIFKIEKE